MDGRLRDAQRGGDHGRPASGPRHRIRAISFCRSGMPSMISRARASAIPRSAPLGVGAAAPWYLAWISDCFRRNACPRRRSLMSLCASVPSNQAAVGPRVLAQHRPRERRRLEGVLNQIRGKFPVALGAYARVPEQPPVMSPEKAGQFIDMVRRDRSLVGVICTTPRRRRRVHHVY